MAIMTDMEKRLAAKVAEMRAKVFVGDNGWYRLYNLETKGSYWVHPERESCTCEARKKDYYGLGTCKHIRFIEEWLESFDDYCEWEAIFEGPTKAHSFSSMVLANKYRFHSVWVELREGRYVVHYKSYRSKVTGRIITLAERLREATKEIAPIAGSYRG